MGGGWKMPLGAWVVCSYLFFDNWMCVGDLLFQIYKIVIFPCKDSIIVIFIFGLSALITSWMVYYLLHACISFLILAITSATDLLKSYFIYINWLFVADDTNNWKGLNFNIYLYFLRIIYFRVKKILNNKMFLKYFNRYFQWIWLKDKTRKSTVITYMPQKKNWRKMLN